MPRSGEDARRRLQKAALELYYERGYDQTTTAEIAARAGLTERTFFRHFPDKREVLFDGTAPLSAIFKAALAEAPRKLSSLEALFLAFRAVEPMFENNRPFAGRRQKVIDRTPALRERELAKGAELIAVLTEGLRRRGVEDRLATLAAQTGMAVFSHAVDSWIDDPSESLDAHLLRAFKELNNLTSTRSKTGLTVR